MSAQAPRSKLFLAIRGNRIFDVAPIQHSSTFAVVYDEKSNKEIGRTEMVKRSLDPVFKTCIPVEFRFEVKKTIRITLHEKAGDTLGSVTVSLGELLAERYHTVTLPLTGYTGTLTIAALCEGATRGQLELLELNGKNLKNMDAIGLSDPYFLLSRILANGSKHVLYKSEVVEESLNPLWRPAGPFDLSVLCSGMLGAPCIRVDVFDKDSVTDDFQGYFECSVKDLSTRGKEFRLLPNEASLKSQSATSLGSVFVNAVALTIEPPLPLKEGTPHPAIPPVAAVANPPQTQGRARIIGEETISSLEPVMSDSCPLSIKSAFVAPDNGTVAEPGADKEQQHSAVETAFTTNDDVSVTKRSVVAETSTASLANSRKAPLEQGGHEEASEHEEAPHEEASEHEEAPHEEASEHEEAPHAEAVPVSDVSMQHVTEHNLAVPNGYGSSQSAAKQSPELTAITTTAACPEELFPGSVAVPEGLRSRDTFLNLIGAGLQLNIAFSIDFTGSNGPPRESGSLHFINDDPSAPLNSYQMAMTAIADIVQQYDSDRMFPAFGFGAKIPPLFDEAKHCFPLSGVPALQGMDSVMAAYRAALEDVRLYGPTKFAPSIRHVTQLARQTPSTYTIHLILTDGVINDMEDTIDAITEADDAPYSILIVGIGSEDFTKMKQLDNDGGRLVHSQTKKPMSRDIVQFVWIEMFHGGSQEALAEELLREIPDQVESWAELNSNEVAALFDGCSVHWRVQ